MESVMLTHCMKSLPPPLSLSLSLSLSDYVHGCASMWQPACFYGKKARAKILWSAVYPEHTHTHTHTQETKTDPTTTGLHVLDIQFSALESTSIF